MRMIQTYQIKRFGKEYPEALAAADKKRLDMGARKS